jgi:membrane protein required for colicin V production
MGLTDWILLAVLVFSAVLGLWRGLVYEVLSVAGWVAAFVLAQAYAVDVAQWLPMEGASPALEVAAGFILIFIAVAFAGGLVAWLVRKLVTSVGLRPVDRVLGGAFGVVRGLVMLLGFAMVVNMTQMQQAAWWRSSVSAGLLSGALHELKPLLPEALSRHLP